MRRGTDERLWAALLGWVLAAGCGAQPADQPPPVWSGDDGAAQPAPAPDAGGETGRDASAPPSGDPGADDGGMLEGGPTRQPRDGGMDAGADGGDPPPVVDPDCTREWVNLLVNGDFESGPAEWGSNPATIVQTGPVPPAEGAYMAWLLGEDDEQEAITQTVTIPPETTGLRLVGQRCFRTAEAGDVPYDTLAVQLLDGQDTEVAKLAEYSNRDALGECSWEPFELPSDASRAGQTLTLRLGGQTDGSSPTSFCFDGLRLEAFACPP